MILRLFFTSLIVIIIATTCPAKNSPIVVAVSVIDKSEEIHSLIDSYLQEISRRVGLDFQPVYLPSQRSIHMLKRGEIHAEISRIAAYKRYVPNTIMVPEPLMTIPYHVYTLKKDITINGWKSLEPYSLATVSGSILAKEYLHNHTVYELESTFAAFNFLLHGRADCFVENEAAALATLARPEFTDNPLKKLQPPIAQLNTYTFFSGNYPQIAKRYSQALSDMKDDGSYSRLFLHWKATMKDERTVQ